jgi:L-alanine-DL-glutamate epimerase-like enolase superfamily enzyme
MISNRRQFLQSMAFGAGGMSLPGLFLDRSIAQEVKRAASTASLEIAGIERTTLHVPFREVPGRAMSRELPHWRYTELCEVVLKSGARGFGETLLYYTWGPTGDDDVKRAMGKNAAALLWDDSLGAGLQTALFDAVGRAMGVPVHALLGQKVNERTPLSWWNIDTSPEDMASECATAFKEGYLSYKTKGRPWFDIWKQVEESAKVVPENFKIDMDFNATLLDAERAIPICKELEKYPQIDIYESPIPQSDVVGNRAIREATRVQIALHYGTPSPEVVVREQVCDGFVVGGGASRVMHQGHFCQEVDMPFWLQLVGTGITAAFSLHFGGVLKKASWPAVNCHQLYTHKLLAEPIEVKNGHATVPDGAGLGFELDRDAIEKLKVEKPAKRPDPARMVEVSWPDGRRLYLASNNQVNFVLNAGMNGTIPFYERDVDARLYSDDGSEEWRALYNEACKAPVLVK